MTVEEHLRIVIGDLVLNVARLLADKDTLQQDIERLKAQLSAEPPEGNR